MHSFKLTHWVFFSQSDSFLAITFDCWLPELLSQIGHLILWHISSSSDWTFHWKYSDFQINCQFTVKVKITLRLTSSQSASLGVEPHLGLMTRYLLLFDSYGLVFEGRPLWREDGSVFCICCRSSPTQTFSGPSPLGLATIFYCLRFETSLFVASYDSQDHDGGIRSRFHTGFIARFSLYSLGPDLIENTSVA
jgi:hypothetical protein